MSANAAQRPGAPESEEVVLRLPRTASTFEVRVATWPDGHVGLTFASRRAPWQIWRFISVRREEARQIAAALLALADREGWK